MISSSTTRLVRLADIEATPWKNRGGVTREIATGVRPDGGEGWGWRVSLADVAADGLFSIFPDTDRVIAAIEGTGMDLLRRDGTAVALEPFVPVRFAGEEPFDGRLRGGPVRDLNVMVRRGLFTAEMEIHQSPGGPVVQTGRGDCLLVHLLQGRCSVKVDAGALENLAPAETLVHEGAGHIEVQIGESGRAAVIRVSAS